MLRLAGSKSLCTTHVRGHPPYGHLQELLLGDGVGTCVLKVPPGVAHGYKVLSAEAHLFALTSRTYDPADGATPHDDPTIGYDWIAGPAIT